MGEKQGGPQEIQIRGARVHNLKNVDVNVPLHKIVGIAGVSGSGKSSLALGVLYAEGSRRYLEALSHLHPAADDPGGQGGRGPGALRARGAGPPPAAGGAGHPQHLWHRDGAVKLPAADVLPAGQPPLPQRARRPPLPWRWRRNRPSPARSAAPPSTRRGRRSLPLTPRGLAAPAGAPALCGG